MKFAESRFVKILEKPLKMKKKAAIPYVEDSLVREYLDQSPDEFD